MKTRQNTARPRLPERYQLERMLGQGGMAQVWLARDLEADAMVAIKVLFEHLREDALVIERFRREIIASRKLINAHVIEIFDLIETDNVTALVMEYHPGRDLKEIIRRDGALAPERAASITAQLLEGLGAAHRAGIIHRDIKPQNVLVDREDNVKIVDFGLARVDDLIGITTHTTTLGTIEYMAPEQVGALVIDARADLYALGVMFYELLTGKLPYLATTPIAMARMHRDDPIPSVRTIKPDLPESFDRIIQRAMAKAPQDRFSTAEEFARALAGEAFDAQIPTAILCPACKTPLLATWAHCIACGHDPGASLSPGNHRVFVPTPPILRASTVGQAHAIGDQQQQNLDTMLSNPLLGLDPNMMQRRRRLVMRKPPFVVAAGLSEESARELQSKVEALGIPAEVNDTTQNIEKLTFYRAFLVNRRLLLFGAMWWFGSGCIWCPVSVFLEKGMGFAQNEAFLASVVICISIAVITYLLGFTRGLKPLAVLRGERTRDTRRDWLPADATRAHETLKSKSSKALFRQILSAGLTLRERASNLSGAPETIPTHITELLAAATRRAIHIGELEKFVHAHPPHDLYETIQRTDALIEREEDTDRVSELIETKTRTASLLATVDERHHELAHQHQRMLDVLTRLRQMERQLDGEHDSREQDLEQVSMILGDLADELELSSGEQQVEQVRLAAQPVAASH